MNLIKIDDNTLQKELTALKQEKMEQHEENQLLKQRLARMEAGIDDDTNNDLNYDSSENESKNDTNYDTECSNSEEDDDDDYITTSTQKNKNNHHLIETYADPSYVSSDNKDPRDDVYLD
jgi:hypothetical protein